MKKFATRKSLLAIVLGVAVAGISTSAFAATCPQPAANHPAQQPMMYSYPQFQQQWVIYPQLNHNVPQQQQYFYQSTKKQYQPAPRSSQPVRVPKQSANTPSQAANAPAEQTPDAAQGNVDSYAKEVFSLVNQERAKAGLQPLKLDEQLSSVAKKKAVDMANNHYFDQISPTLGSPADMISQSGIQYMTMGENIAMGQRSPQEVMQQWMDSQGHRENIMNPSFDTIGIAYYNGYWVQEFIGN
ncbi:CAP domain-containing protein [Brevibacillus massiliensis]|uniref:CAP domain-containing protein n=1 Tax=Brevibacillus massiliensis TaxID=1118054 RepID=UPI0002DBD18A|nr:CAP domain-containing protein [Brevibacillus massiliensis]